MRLRAWWRGPSTCARHSRRQRAANGAESTHLCTLSPDMPIASLHRIDDCEMMHMPVAGKDFHALGASGHHPPLERCRPPARGRARIAASKLRAIQASITREEMVTARPAPKPLLESRALLDRQSTRNRAGVAPSVRLEGNRPSRAPTDSMARWIPSSRCACPCSVQSVDDVFASERSEAATDRAAGRTIRSSVILIPQGGPRPSSRTLRRRRSRALQSQRPKGLEAWPWRPSAAQAAKTKKAQRYVVVAKLPRRKASCISLS